MAGLIIRKEYFDPGGATRNRKRDKIFERAQMMVDNVAFSWLGPVCILTLGNKLIFDGDLFVSVLPLSLMLFGGLFIGQILSAGLAARFTGNFTWPESWMIGFAMLGRAELAFVVLEIAYVQYQVMTPEAFHR